MLDAMEPQVLSLVAYKNTVKELWDYLAVLYSGKNNISRIFSLSQDFYRVTRGDRPLVEYLADYQHMYEELNALLPITADIPKMQEQREQLAVISPLGSLGPEFEGFRSQVLGGSVVPTLADTFARLIRHSPHTSNATVPGDVRESSALIVPSGRGGRIGSRSGPRGGGRGTGIGRSIGVDGGRGMGVGKYPTIDGIGSAPLVCYHCGETGHIKRKCWKLYGRPTQPRYANTVANPFESTDSPSVNLPSEEKTVTLSNEQYASFLQYQLATQAPSSSKATFVQTIGNASACLSTTRP
ncbi:zf-CCHC domain-containing protein [Cephalotus follicularis]|uniref:Zf-CCHC domain-containing protein n=1 Tax=Cephalotus follicularis TaxID=3775 RepID=A0A1Q3D2Q8_CEPFO|nr:zf-CCHC domain-containing protein [Cephalotus follicularis]